MLRTHAGLRGTWAKSSCWQMDSGQEFQSPPFPSSTHRFWPEPWGMWIEGDKQCFPVGCARLLVPVSPRPAGPCWRGRGAQRPPTVWGTEGAGQQPHSPALAAASTKVPSPWLWKRKLGPFSLSQKISEALLLRMGPTLTPRPPRRRHQPTVSGGSKASGLRGGRGCL